MSKARCEQKNGQSKVGDIDSLKAALDMHRAPIHACGTGMASGIWAANALHESSEQLRAASDSAARVTLALLSRRGAPNEVVLAAIPAPRVACLEIASNNCMLASAIK